jgi:hypothetical protein
MHESMKYVGGSLFYCERSELSVGRARPGFDDFQGVRSRGPQAVLGCTPRTHDDGTTKKGAKPVSWDGRRPKRGN